MRDTTPQLYSEAKMRGSRFRPVHHGMLFGYGVKGRVDFDRIELRSEPLQPAALRKTLLVDLSAPVLVIPTAGSDERLCHASALGNRRVRRIGKPGGHQLVSEFIRRPCTACSYCVSGS